MEQTFLDLNGSSTTAQTFLDSNGTSTSTTFLHTHGLYSKPELIDTIVYPDCIELVYRRQLMVSNNFGMPNPEIYAEVYSRHDGTMFTKQGIYIPPQSESYEF
ncbi:MAG: hypothetical protein ACOVNU_04135 [Candidatus Kapaibacteriota bacterium]